MSLLKKMSAVVSIAWICAGLESQAGPPPPHVAKWGRDHLADAQIVFKEYGIPISATLGISGFESGWGTAWHLKWGSNAYFNLLMTCSDVKDMTTVVQANDKQRCIIKHPDFLAAARHFARTVCTPKLHGRAVAYARGFHGDPSDWPDFDRSTWLDKLGPSYDSLRPDWAAKVKSAIYLGAFASYDTHVVEAVCPK
jgi:hypothetical protein